MSRRSTPRPADHVTSLFDLARQINRLSPYQGNPERYFLARETLAENIVAIARSLQGPQTNTAAQDGPLGGGDTRKHSTASKGIRCHAAAHPAMHNGGRAR